MHTALYGALYRMVVRIVVLLYRIAKPETRVAAFKPDTRVWKKVTGFGIPSVSVTKCVLL